MYLALLLTLAGCATESRRQTSRDDVQPVRLLARPPAETPGKPPTELTPQIVIDEAGKRVARAVERGTGTFVRSSTGGIQRALTTDASGEVTLNLVDADLREVIHLVLNEGLGANYMVDPTVAGRVTIQTMRPVPPKDLIAILDSMLRMNSAALVQVDGLYKVVPIEQALSSGPIVGLKPLPAASRPGFSVQVIPLRYVSPVQMRDLLAPFAPLGGAIQADPARNLLLLAGSTEQLATLNDLVASFDVDWLKGMSFGLFPLDTAAAIEIAKELDQVFDTETGPLAGALRFVPTERLNAILVVASQPEYLDRAELWIERLDRTSTGEEAQIYVYPVQNARAANLAEVLSEIFNAQGTTIGGPGILAPGLEPVELRSTSMFDIGEVAEPREERNQVDSNSDRGFRSPRRVAAAHHGGPDSSIRIIADDATNSLVIHAKPGDYRKIREALEKLDVRPLQVLIEATIAEVTLRNQLRYGIEWFFRFGSNQASLTSGETNLPVRQFPGFSALFTSADDLRLVLNALENLTDIDVISSPQVVVLDNQTAQLQVGDEVPILTQQVQSAEADANIINSVEQRQTGVILSVTPRVNASGLVTLEIQQEVSDVVPTTTSSINSPTISQRSIASTVAVQSGETVALGGLIRDNTRNTRSGLPFLSRLPAIGPLFGSTDKRNERTELIVLLTPSVIANTEQARAVTDELLGRLRGLAPLPGT